MPRVQIDGQWHSVGHESVRDSVQVRVSDSPWTASQRITFHDDSGYQASNIMERALAATKRLLCESPRPELPPFDTANVLEVTIRILTPEEAKYGACSSKDQVNEISPSNGEDAGEPASAAVLQRKSTRAKRADADA